MERTTDPVVPEGFGFWVLGFGGFCSRRRGRIIDWLGTGNSKLPGGELSICDETSVNYPTHSKALDSETNMGRPLTSLAVENSVQWPPRGVTDGDIESIACLLDPYIVGLRVTDGSIRYRVQLQNR